MRRDYIIEIICALFIVLFVYAGGSKIIEFDEFRTNLGQSPILTILADWLVWAVPGIEFIIAFGLAFHKTRLLALYGSYTLMLMFTLYIITIMNYSFFVPCSCGGVLATMGWGEHLVFNIFFVLLAIVGIVLMKWKSPVSNTPSLAS